MVKPAVIALVPLLLVWGCRKSQSPASAPAENTPATLSLAPADDENAALSLPQTVPGFLKKYQRIVLLVNLGDSQTQHRQTVMDILRAIMLQMDSRRGRYDVICFGQGPREGASSAARPAGKAPPGAWLDGWGADRTALAAVRQAHRQLAAVASSSQRAIVILTPAGLKSDTGLLIYLDAPDAPKVPIFPCPLMAQQCSQETLWHLGKIAQRTGGTVLSPDSFSPTR